MAAVIMDVLELNRTLVDATAHAYAELGNAGTPFLMPNDGKTMLLIHGVTGDIFTFTPTTDEYGRTETLAKTVAVGDVAFLGPFPPALWNNGAGQVTITPAVGNAADILLAVKLP